MKEKTMTNSLLEHLNHEFEEIKKEVKYIEERNRGVDEDIIHLHDDIKKNIKEIKGEVKNVIQRNSGADEKITHLRDDIKEIKVKLKMLYKGIVELMKTLCIYMILLKK